MAILNRLFTWLDSKRDYAVFDRPIFILSAPRSGSTFLFELLRQFDEAWAYQGESDHVWQSIFPIERLAEPSAWVSLDEASPTKLRQLRRSLYRQALWTRESMGRPLSLADRLAWRPIRYVDKTIANCFHLEVIERAFPGARYIFLLRDPRPTISSMLVGQKGSKRQGLGCDIDPSNTLFARHLYSYPLPPGWIENMLGRNEGEAYAWAWSQYVTKVDQFFGTVASERQLTVFYESLVDNLERETARLAHFCEFELNDRVAGFVRLKPHSRTTATPPDTNKWRRLHSDLMDTLEPIYSNAMRSTWARATATGEPVVS